MGVLVAVGSGVAVGFGAAHAVSRIAIEIIVNRIFMSLAIIRESRKALLSAVARRPEADEAIPKTASGDFFACFAPSQRRNQLFYFFASPLFIFP